MPQWRTLHDTRTRVDSLRQLIEQGRVRMAAAKESYEFAQQAKSKLPVLDSAIPDQSDLGPFLEDVSRIADELRLANRDITPSREVKCRELVILPIEISFQGPFDSAYSFITRLETLPRIARIQRLEFTMLSDQPGELSSSMTVFVYHRRS